MRPIPSYGLRIELKEWVRLVRGGCYKDKDGWGKYATETEMTEITIFPSYVRNKMIKYKYKYIVWFNR